jgi:hypothetical protein
MEIKANRKIDSFQFDNLAELRDWLNRFNAIDLSTVCPNTGSHFELRWFEETLSDRSVVFNADLLS